MHVHGSEVHFQSIVPDIAFKQELKLKHQKKTKIATVRQYDVTYQAYAHMTLCYAKAFRSHSLYVIGFYIKKLILKFFFL